MKKMKKLALTVLMVFLVAFGVNAQKDLMNPSAKNSHALSKGVISQKLQAKGPVVEDFEGTFPSIGWSLTTGSGDWAQAADVDHTTGTGNSAIYDCYNINGTVPAYLQTPEMTVTTGDATFSFWCNYYLVATGTGTANLYVDKSTDGGATWTAGTTDYLATITKDTWTQFTIDLTANIGQNVIVRFKAVSDYGYYNIAIDDIAGPAQNLPAHDLGVAAISPAGHVLTGSTVIPHVTVTNFGAADEATYSVLLSDGAGYSQTVNVSTTLLSLGNADLAFPAWTPADANYTLTATVTVTGDVVATNNSLTSAVEVRPYQFGDIVMEFNAQTGSAVGVETDGTNIYVQSWSSAVYERYAMDGTYVNNFTIAAASSARDLAYDGTNFYGAPNSTSLFKLNFTAGSEALVSTITAPQACRAIAYDSDDNTFWGNSGSGVMKEFSTAGVLTGRTFTPSVGIYGAAYDNYSNAAIPTIWGSDWSGGLAKLVEWTLAGTATGRVVDLTSHFATADAGGLAVYKEGNTAYLLADFQTAPTNTIVKIFLANVSSSATDIVSFDLNGLTPAVTGTVDATAHTVALTVPFGTAVTALVPTIAVSAGATISPLTAVAQDFTAPVTYTVTAEDGTTTQTWTVTVTVAAGSTANDILTFDFATPATTGIIDATAHTVALNVPFGTDVTALVPTIAVSTFATVSPATAVAQNFTAPVVYTVTAQDGTTQAWTVTVTVASATDNDILTFNFNGLTPAVVGTVDATAHTVALTVPYGTAVTALVPTITVSAGATVSPATAVAQDFTNAVIYNVTAIDGTTVQPWTVTVTVTAAATAKDILTFDFNALTPAVVGTVNATAHTVALTVPYGTAVTALVPTITVSDFATVSPATAVAADFTAPVVYTVTAQDGTTQAWTVTVTVAPNTATDIVTFNFNALTPAVVGTVNATTHTVALTVPFGTAVTALVPTISLSAGATVSPATAVAADFTAPVTYTVTAEDGTTTQAWIVTVTVAAGSSAKDILTFNFNGLTPAVVGTVNATAHTVALTVPYGTNVTALVPTITVSALATVSPATAVAQNFTAPVVYTVTAQDGTTQAWTVTVTISVGINEVTENVASIYPNPANDVVNVKMNSTINKIAVVNMNGQVVAESVINNNEGSINVSNMANGMYFLRIETANGITMNKIQIVK
jgi:hypothetical protein